MMSASGQSRRWSTVSGRSASASCGRPTPARPLVEAGKPCLDLSGAVDRAVRGETYPRLGLASPYCSVPAGKGSLLEAIRDEVGMQAWMPPDNGTFQGAPPRRPASSVLGREPAE